MVGKHRAVKAPEVCPVCGTDVPRNAKVCSECGADERSGWSENAACDGLDLPDEEFDYDKFADEEFGAGRSGKLKPRHLSWFWWIAALLAIAALLLLFLLH
jgi:hypothetical protein